MTTIPPIQPPLARPFLWKRNLPVRTAFAWLNAGWQDFTKSPLPSIIYGLSVFIISVLLFVSIVAFNLDYVLFPALAGFMIMGPVIAIGLYEKSRQIHCGETASLGKMLFITPKSGGQVVFTGILLSLIMLLWMRAAVILYALFFGIVAFPGLDDIIHLLLRTPSGWVLLITGTIVGGLFASFSFAISVFSTPMLLDKRTDALTAMGSSMAMVWRNLPVMIFWGLIVLLLVLTCILTGFLALIVVFPVLGHATWHAYNSIFYGERLHQ